MTISTNKRSENSEKESEIVQMEWKIKEEEKQPESAEIFKPVHFEPDEIPVIRVVKDDLEFQVNMMTPEKDLQAYNDKSDEDACWNSDESEERYQEERFEEEEKVEEKKEIVSASDEYEEDFEELDEEKENLLKKIEEARKRKDYEEKLLNTLFANYSKEIGREVVEELITFLKRNIGVKTYLVISLY